MKNKKTNKTYQAPSGDSGVRNYIQKKGFYIALFVLTAILVGSIFVTSYINQSQDIGSSFNDEAWKAAIAESEQMNSAEAVSDIEVINSDASNQYAEINDSEDIIPENSISADNEVPTVEQAESVTTDTAVLAEDIAADEEVVAVSAEVSGELMLSTPCVGGVTKEYSMNELVYSETMDDWRTHSGIDISADSGAQVKAAADGIVDKVYTDDVMGNVVIIDHGNGTKTLYGNLQSADYIEEGRTVSQGDIIGGVGESSSEEKADGPHLHFEVLKDDEPIEPKF